MGTRKKRTWRVALAAVMAWLAVPVMAGASSVKGPDAVLYEVTENMYFYDAAGKLIPPSLILSGLAVPVARVADATLQGSAKLGNPLCPSALLVTHPKAKTCTVTAAGQDNISLATGKGSVSGTYAVVLNIDNPVDAAEFVVQTGTFSGEMDLSMRPLGSIVGTFTPTGTSLRIPYTGTFRLPFSVGLDGRLADAKRGNAAFYLSDDGKKFPVDKSELSLGAPLVRLELNF